MNIADVEYFAVKPGCTTVGSFEICTWLEKKGITSTHSMNLGGEWDFGFGTVKMVYAAHSNSLPDGSYGGTAAGYIIKTKDICMYYAGDTALTNEMKLIPDRLKPDLAFLPIGSNYTMNAEDAALASQFIPCQTVIGMHYDTFGWIKIDHSAAIEAFKNKNTNLILMKIGETKTF